MNRIRRIRARLGVTQQAFADGISQTRVNVSYLERGQTVTPDTAKRLIAYAASLGVKLTYNQIYGDEELPAPRMLPLRQLEKA